MFPLEFLLPLALTLIFAYNDKTAAVSEEGNCMLGKKLKQTLSNWCYLGYDRDILRAYEVQIASDNLRVLAGALILAAVVTAAELAFVFTFAMTEPGVAADLWYTARLLLITAAATGGMGAVYLLVRHRSNQAFYSRCLTTVFLSLWTLLSLVIGTLLYPTDYAVLACGFFLLIQVVFDAYPVENLMFVSSAFIGFAAMSFFHKPFDIFLYDLINALPFVLTGLFLSWIKSRSKWSALINADAMVQLKTQRLENELTEERIKIMLSQIQPHFLYNSLGVIRALCRKDPALAEQATIEFTDFLRGNLDSIKSEKPVLFEQELAHTKSYLALEQLRFADRLTVTYDLEATVFSIPTLTLQPIVENAVRYGVCQRERGGTVCISTREYADCVKITVADDGVGFDPYTPKEDGRTHIGIHNVRERLEQMCGGALDIESTLNVGTVATITLPKEEY